MVGPALLPEFELGSGLGMGVIEARVVVVVTGGSAFQFTLVDELTGGKITLGDAIGVVRTGGVGVTSDGVGS